jgi:hypothetical protein
VSKPRKIELTERTRMKIEKHLIVLWIIFGFILVTGIDSILYFVIHLIYFSVAEMKVSYNIMTFIFPILTFILYSFTAIFVLKKLNKSSINYKLPLYKFPKKPLLIFSLIILILYPLTNKLSGVYYAEYLNNNTMIEMGEYLIFYGWFNIGFTISQILVLLGLATYSFFQLKKLNSRNLKINNN